jgi:hypothetical protein
VYGNSVTLTAALSPIVVGSYTVSVGETVSFFNGSTLLGTGPLNGCGVATLTITALIAGNDSLTASYGGDTNFAASNSAAVPYTVSKVAPALSLICTEVPYDGNAHSCTGAATGVGGVTVSGTWSFSPASATNAGSTSVTGTFTSSNTNYSSGGTASGTLKIDAAAQAISFSASTISYASGVTYGTTPLTLSAAGGASGNPVVFSILSGPATLSGNTLTITGAGAVVIAANQAGNGNYSAATQVTEKVPVSQAQPLAAVSANPAATFLKNTVMLTATVSSQACTPTGTVTFLDGTTPLGTVALSGGGATLNISTLAAGPHSITVNYSGDVNYLPLASSPFTELVEDFSIDFADGVATAMPGASTQFPFTVTPPGGETFPAAIAFSISGLPEGATATFSPTTLAAGAGATIVTMSIQLPQTMAAAQPRNGLGRRMAPFALALLLLPFASRLRRAGRRLGRSILLLLLLGAGMAAALGLSGCGSTSGFFVQAQKTYTVTVTGFSGALSHSAYVTLTVE